MKRILNLNDFAPPAFKVIVLLMIVIPGGLWLLRSGLAVLGLQVPALLMVAKAAFFLGGACLLVMLALILLEQAQDQYLFRRYDRSLGKRVPIGDGLAECPACGYRGLHNYERACPACGKTLD